MTTEDTTTATNTGIVTETEVETEAPTEAPVSSSAELRAYADRVKKENKELRRELMDERLTKIGLSTAEGLGKAIVKEYEGPMTVEAIAAYAESEYGHRSNVEMPAQVTEGAARAQTLDASSQTVTPPIQRDEVEELEAKLSTPEATRADAVASMSAKLRQVVRPS